MRNAKKYLNSRSQAVRPPRDFKFKNTEVFIRHMGEDVVGSPRPQNWSDYLANGQVAPDDFMIDVDGLARWN